MDTFMELPPTQQIWRMGGTRVGEWATRSSLWQMKTKMLAESWLTYLSGEWFPQPWSPSPRKHLSPLEVFATKTWLLVLPQLTMQELPPFQSLDTTIKVNNPGLKQPTGGGGGGDAKGGGEASSWKHNRRMPGIAICGLKDSSLQTSDTCIIQ